MMPSFGLRRPRLYLAVDAVHVPPVGHATPARTGWLGFGMFAVDPFEFLERGLPAVAGTDAVVAGGGAWNLGDEPVDVLALRDVGAVRLDHRGHGCGQLGRDPACGLRAFVEEVACVVAHEHGRFLSRSLGTQAGAGGAVLEVLDPRRRLLLGLARLSDLALVLTRVSAGDRVPDPFELRLGLLSLLLQLAELGALGRHPLAVFV
jgi:hypothetical protein